MDLLIGAIAAGGGALIGGLGLYLPAHKRSRRFKVGLSVLLIAVVGGSVYSFIQASRTSEKFLATLMLVDDRTTGGDNYGFFCVDLSELTEDYSFPLQFHATGDLYDLRFKFSPWHLHGDAATEEYQRGLYGEATGAPIGRSRVPQLTIPIGDYRIEIDAKNGHWVQHLYVHGVDGHLRQYIVLYSKDGTKLYEEGP